jgi:hypothetical protein
MKPSLLILTVCALTIAAVAASSQLSAAPTSGSAARGAGPVVLPRAAPAGQTTQWGHIKSVTRKGRRYEMRFDPGLFLHGVTAERACGCNPVPNDYYTVEESHRLLTYVVPANAPVTVITRGVTHTRITVAELAQIVKGKNPKHRRLLEPTAGFWILIGSKYPNPALTLDQQYQP